MAFDPATVNGTNATTGTAETDPSPRVVPTGQVIGLNIRQDQAPDFRPPVGLRPNAKALYSIKFVGYGPEADEKSGLGQEERGYSKHLYGSYWDASLPVVSLAVFEAQLFVQMSLNGRHVQATPRQGNEAYIATKNVLQMATVTQTNVDDIVEANEFTLRINLKA